MNKEYKKQVDLLCRIVPALSKIEEFALHGGTAINLFMSDMPRYSVDLDITYIPIANREESVEGINSALDRLKTMLMRAIPNGRFNHNVNSLKLDCFLKGTKVKLEVSNVKRGLLEEPQMVALCERAQREFDAYCDLRIVSTTELYGGKIAAALSRQHPRDIFDYRQMKFDDLSLLKSGLMLNILGDKKPITDLLNPNLLDQRDAFENQFAGMADVAFSYADFEESRLELFARIKELFTRDDLEFLLSFKQGEPDWTRCCIGDVSHFPSVQWKLQNILKLKSDDPAKHRSVVEKFIAENLQDIEH